MFPLASGHTCHELFALRTGKIGRIPDLVVWPGNAAARVCAGAVLSRVEA